MRIYLVGFTGVGKTTMAEELAERLGYSWADLDQYLVNEHGKPIEELFEQGVRRFRRMERDALIASTNIYKSNVVIACGGGTPNHYGGMDFMKKNGIVVYLYLEFDQWLKSVRENPELLKTRPILAKKSQNSWQKLYNQRLPKYRQAHVICDVSAVQALDLLTNRLDLLTKA